MVFSTGSFSDNVGKAANVSGAGNGTKLTINDAGSATFAIPTSANTSKILAAGAGVELAKFTLNATNDDLKLVDFYTSAK